MAVFGEFETTETIPNRGVLSLFRARKASGGPSRYVIKACLKQENEEGFAEFARWLRESVAVQQKVLSHRGRHWAPIHDAGESPEGPYYVGDYYSGTLYTLIDRGLKVDEQGLYHAISAILLGLAELKKACNRIHGGLTVDRILLKGEGKLVKRRVHLTDPYPEDLLARSMTPDSDARSLGEIIYQVVGRHRKIESSVAAVPATEDWSHLGKNAASWKSFCDRLLDPYGPFAAGRPEDLLKALKRLKPRSGFPLKTAAALCILGGGAAAAYQFLPQYLPEGGISDIDFKIPSFGGGGDNLDTVWVSYLDDYETWLRPLSKAVRDADENSIWRTDPYLAEKVTAPLASFDGSLHPLDLAGMPDGDLFLYREEPPEELKKNDAASERIKVASAVTTQLRTDLAAWPGFVAGAEAAKTFNQRGWTQLAATFGSDAAEPAFDANLPTTIEQTAGIGVEVSQLDARWEELRTAAQPVRDWGDPFLARIDRVLGAELRDASSPEALTARMGSLHRKVESLALFLDAAKSDGSIAFDAFQSAGFDGKPGNGWAAVDEWREALGKYRVMTADPRDQRPWEPARDAADKAIAELARVAAGEETPLTQRMQGVANSVEALQKIPALATRLTEIETAQAAIVRDYEGIQAEAEKRLAEMAPDVDGWIARKTEEQLAVDVALQPAWEGQRQALFAQAREADTGAAFVLQQSKFQAAREFFTGLNSALTDVRALPPDTSPEVQSMVEQAAAPFDTDLRRMVTSALVGWKDFQPSAVGPFMQQLTVAGAAANRRGITKDLTDAASDLKKLDAALDTGAGLDAFPGQFADRWLNRPDVLAPFSAASPDARADIEAVKSLRQIASATPDAALAMITPSAPNALAQAAWSRLATATNWPTDTGTLSRLGSAASAMMGRDLPDATRAKITQEAGTLWLNFAQTARQKSTFEAALDMRGQFRVSDTSLPPEMRYKAALRGHIRSLEQVGVASTPPDRARAFRDEVVRSLQAIPGHAPASALSSQLQRVDFTPVAANVDVENLGPAQKEWKVKSTNGGEVTFNWTIFERRQQVAFERFNRPGADEFQTTREVVTGRVFNLSFVQVNTPSGVWYLARTETPLELFLKWIDENKLEPAIAQLMPLLASSGGNDPRLGPRVFEPLGGNSFQLRQARSWLVDRSGWRGSLHSSRNNPDRSSSEKVHAESPVQYVSPQLALYFAESLGCTLPSPDVWAAAAAATGQPDKLNLRDAAWSKQQAYAAEKGAGNPATPWPDADIFIPTELAGSPRGPAARAANAGDDGYLFFARTGSGSGTFNHLFGNVAEYLLRPGPANGGKGQFYVAGASALSPPEMDPSKAYPCDASLARNGFSDVGFRLAFRASSVSSGEQIMALLRGAYETF